LDSLRLRGGAETGNQASNSELLLLFAR